MPTTATKARRETRAAKRKAAPVARSEASHAFERAGLVARGIVYVILGYLAAQVAANGGHGSQPADASGALRVVAKQPLGRPILVLLALGLVGFAVLQLIDAVYLHDRKRNAATRRSSRVVSVGGVIVYCVFAAMAVRVAFGSQTGGPQKAEELTARLLRWTGGRELVAAVGVGLVIGGVVLAYEAFTAAYLDRLDKRRLRGRWRTAVTVVGSVGQFGRALAYSLVGAFIVDSAVTFDARKSQGLDGSLRTLAAHVYGLAGLAVVALGLVAFGLYCWAEARWRKV